jgi:hypothetical protein
LVGRLVAARSFIDVDRLHAMGHPDLVQQRTAPG